MRECDGLNIARVPLKRTGDGLARLSVPDADCLVDRAEDDTFPIRRECDGCDTVREPLKRTGDGVACLNVPDADCLVP